MKYGMNTLLFACPFTNDSTSLFAQLKTWGFDSVEIGLVDPNDIDPQHVKRELDEQGLQCSAICAIMTDERDLRGNDQQQKTGVEYLETVMQQMQVLGCQKIVGPLYSAVGRTEAYEEAEQKQQWQTVAGHLQKLAEKAEADGQLLCVEPLNRFETDMVNTAEQGLEMLRQIDRPAMRLHLDSFHMNIEEKDLPAAIRSAGNLLGHLHACGTDRGTPGSDHTDWAGIAEALQAVGYDDDVVIESFTLDVKPIARAAAIWRRIQPTRDEIAVDGINFLRKTLG